MTLDDDEPTTRVAEDDGNPRVAIAMEVEVPEEIELVGRDDDHETVSARDDRSPNISSRRPLYRPISRGLSRTKEPHARGHGRPPSWPSRPGVRVGSDRLRPRSNDGPDA